MRAATPVSRLVSIFGWSAVVIVSLGGLPATTAAQTTSAATTARGLITGMVKNRPFPPQSQSAAEREAIAARSEVLANAIVTGIIVGITTAPVGGSAAGFSYTINPTTGEASPRTVSFGPILMDRALTNGAGAFGFGMSYQRHGFNKFEGIDIRNDGIVTFDNRVRYQSDNFEQFITESLKLEPTVDTVTTVFSYGVTSRLDIGAIIPINHITLKARRTWDYDVSRSFAVDANDRRFFTPGPTGTDFVQEQGSIDKTGIGDITVRAKFGFSADAPEGLGVVVDVRLPTGDEENLLGTGKASGRFALLGSKALGERGNLYASGGYTVGGLSDEINYAFGVDTQLLQRKQLTLSFEVLGENIRDAVKGVGSFPHGPTPGVDARFTPPANVSYLAEEPFFLESSNNVLRAAVGAKYLVARRWLVSGGVFVPVGNDGLTAGVSPYVGLDFSWTAVR
jgi:hypothetical protein